MTRRVHVVGKEPPESGEGGGAVYVQSYVSGSANEWVKRRHLRVDVAEVDVGSVYEIETERCDDGLEVLSVEFVDEATKEVKSRRQRAYKAVGVSPDEAEDEDEEYTELVDGCRIPLPAGAGTTPDRGNPPYEATVRYNRYLSDTGVTIQTFDADGDHGPAFKLDKRDPHTVLPPLTELERGGPVFEVLHDDQQFYGLEYSHALTTEARESVPARAFGLHPETALEISGTFPAEQLRLEEGYQLFRVEGLSTGDQRRDVELLIPLHYTQGLDSMWVSVTFDRGVLTELSPIPTSTGPSSVL